MSASNQISCASCHDPELSWSNGRSLGIGHDHQQGQRNTPSIQNMWEQEIFFGMVGWRAGGPKSHADSGSHGDEPRAGSFA
ncbi:cytochrome c peroxidase [Nitritalea halalkaliphila]|uniref:cytochrome c peroxidase n=1 Tax=Nitritalea halalkaliphila TaxID=590849 RepID=UPI001930D198